MKVLFDTCIIIDALQNRAGFSDNAQVLFRSVAEGKIDGYLTAKSFTDIYYLMHSYFHDRASTLSVMSKLTSLFKLIDTTASDILLAIASSVSDYEDAVMVESGKRSLMDCIVSRDGHFKDADIKIHTPSTLISQL